MMSERETIAAIASGAGRAGIGVVRISGPNVVAIANAVTGHELSPREAHYLPFIDADGEPIDVGIALRFDAPHSFTGEDVLELQGHGGPVVLDLLLTRVVACGARLARPGEFSERAFLNDKLDLAQAEAIADLIDSSSAAAAQAAVRSLSGQFSADVQHITDELVAVRAWLEAALDFSEEDIDFLADPQLQQRTQRLLASFNTLLARAQQGQRLRDGLSLVIAGNTNVGKSSLLNALSGADNAIVTDIAGTTRDVLHADITLDGVPLHLVDTAGMRDTQDVVEREGIRRAQRAIAAADHVLILVDAVTQSMPKTELPETLPRTIVLNKIDLIVGSKGRFSRDVVIWTPCSGRATPHRQPCCDSQKMSCRNWPPKSCGWRSKHSIRLPENSTRKICWARFFRSSASASRVLPVQSRNALYNSQKPVLASTHAVPYPF